LYLYGGSRSAFEIFRVGADVFGRIVSRNKHGFACRVLKLPRRMQKCTGGRAYHDALGSREFDARVVRLFVSYRDEVIEKIAIENLPR